MKLRSFFPKQEVCCSLRCCFYVYRISTAISSSIGKYQGTYNEIVFSINSKVIRLSPLTVILLFEKGILSNLNILFLTMIKSNIKTRGMTVMEEFTKLIQSLKADLGFVSRLCEYIFNQNNHNNPPRRPKNDQHFVLTV